MSREKNQAEGQSPRGCEGGGAKGVTPAGKQQPRYRKTDAQASTQHHEEDHNHNPGSGTGTGGEGRDHDAQVSAKE